MPFQLTEENTNDVEALKAQLAYRQSLQEITNELNSAENLAPVLEDLKDRILSLFNSERMTIYLIDTTSQELYSRFKIGTELSEIRVPISLSSIAGCAASTEKPSTSLMPTMRRRSEPTTSIWSLTKTGMKRAAIAQPRS